MDTNGYTPINDRPRPTRRWQPSISHDGDHNNQVAHTLTACCRCRHRKTRCDAGLPRCGPCERNNEVCDYFDAAKGKKMPRRYVIFLQERVRKLEEELSALTDEKPSDLDVEDLVRGASLVKIKDNDEESRYLGPSSGIAMTRLVMELAKDLRHTKSIKEIVPEKKAQEIRQRFAKEASKPTSKVYPLTSSVAAPVLPSSFDLIEKLIENYNVKVQYLWPVLHEPSFRNLACEVYRGSTDDYQNFTLRIVIAISLQKLDTQYAGLADSYYLAALGYLENTLRARNLGTLQCLALIAQYSMTTPTRTAAYWVVGLAAKLCQELRMTDEATIGLDEHGQPLDAIQTDLRRRLFWIITSLELGLAHSLGRPSTFGTTHDHINVKPFLEVDDRYITLAGVRPGSPISPKKRLAMHFMRMRLLQLEIRRTLYMKKRPSPTDDSDPWFTQMEEKIWAWMAACPRGDEGTGPGETWFKTRCNTMVVFLFRPSPQIPEPSPRAAQLCFEASRFNIYSQRKQIETKSVDLTWIFTQSLFMAINTLLWSLSYPDVRKDHPRTEVETHLQTALEAVYLASIKWPGVESAMELYVTLASACVQAYDGDTDASYGVGSPSSKATATSPQTIDTPSPLNTSSNAHGPLPPTHHATSLAPSPPLSYPVDPFEHGEMPDQLARYQEVNYGYSAPPANLTMSAGSLPMYETSPMSQGPAFDPNSYNNPLPSPVSYGYAPSTAESIHDRAFLFGSLGDQYAQYLEAEYAPQQPRGGLNSEQQSELLNNLESNGLDHILRETSPTEFSNNVGRGA